MLTHHMNNVEKAYGHLQVKILKYFNHLIAKYLKNTLTVILV